MGGGKSRSKSKTTQEDNKLVVDGFANTALGKGASLDKSDHSSHLGIGAKQMTGSAKDQSDNEGVILGKGAQINTGQQKKVYVGANSTYTETSMDENTANLLDTAMTMVYSNSENIIEMAAKREGENRIPSAPKKVPQPTTSPAAPKVSKTRRAATVALVVLVLFVAMKKKKGRK